jgi:hypothetical protein
VRLALGTGGDENISGRAVARARWRRQPALYFVHQLLNRLPRR